MASLQFINSADFLNHMTYLNHIRRSCWFVIHFLTT